MVDLRQCQADVWNPSARAPPEVMLPAAVLSTNHAVLTNRGGVTLANGCRLQGSGLATSVDVAALRFFPTSRLEDCEVSEAVLLAQPGDQVFGHQLLDLIPRVLTARRVLGSGVPFLISQVAVDSFSTLAHAVRTSGHVTRCFTGRPEHGDPRSAAIPRYRCASGRQVRRSETRRVGHLATAGAWLHVSRRSVPEPSSPASTAAR